MTSHILKYNIYVQMYSIQLNMYVIFMYQHDVKKKLCDCDDATVCMSSICMYKVHTYVHVVDIRSVC